MKQHCSAIVFVLIFRRSIHLCNYCCITNKTYCLCFDISTYVLRNSSLITYVLRNSFLTTCVLRYSFPTTCVQRNSCPTTCVLRNSDPLSRVASYCRPPLTTLPPHAHKNELHCQSRRKCTGLLSPVQLSANPYNSPLGPVMTWKSPKGM